MKSTVNKDNKLKLCCFYIGIFILSSLFSDVLAAKSQEDYDYSHRTRNCKVRIITPDSIPIPNLLVGFSLLRHKFIFGGTIRSDGFDSLGELTYGEMFEKYFRLGAPENEMNWGEVMKCTEKCDPDFSKPEKILSWMKSKNILFYGNNLFSNESEELLPVWVQNINSPEEFKLAVNERIINTLTHFKENVSLWNVVNGVVHGSNGLLDGGGILPTKSGDTTILNLILDKAREIDTSGELILTDYDIITDSAAAEEFINRVKPLSDRFDVVGAVAHFGANMDKNSYQAKINYISEQLGKQVLLTDVDFSCDINEAPDKLEELMRSCFANPNVRGIIMGSWHQNYMRTNGLTNYFVDSFNDETDVGERWSEIIEEFTSVPGGFTDDSGFISFNGYVGQYQVWISCFLDTFSVNTGEDTQYVKVVYHHVEEEGVVNNPVSGGKKIEIRVNGIVVPLRIPANYNKQLFGTFYSLAGKRVARFSLTSSEGKNYRIVRNGSSSTLILRVETEHGAPIYSRKIVGVR